MDNAVAEYSFVTAFFRSETDAPTLSSSGEHFNALLSPTTSLSHGKGGLVDQTSHPGPDFGGYIKVDSELGKVNPATTKADQANSDAIWKQILDPVLEYCQVCVPGHPSSIPTYDYDPRLSFDPFSILFRKPFLS